MPELAGYWLLVLDKHLLSSDQSRRISKEIIERLTLPSPGWDLVEPQSQSFACQIFMSNSVLLQVS